ncbi:MAG TPA: hypothetical protein PKE31_09155 [Pseudomonadota bacterium]|nr:hypothetical protein [Pseudomonadota bacterium]
MISTKSLIAVSVALVWGSVASAEEPVVERPSNSSEAAPSEKSATDKANPEKANPEKASPEKADSVAKEGTAKAEGNAAPTDGIAPKSEAANKETTEASSVKVERTATGAKLFRITEGLVVEGQMQKPAAFYVLRRAAIRYDYAGLSKSFLPKIGAAVKAPPF